MTDDAETVRAARGGDAPARERLTGAVRPRIERYLSAIVHDPATVQDVTQDTLPRVVRHIDKLREPARFESWALSIAVRQCRNHLREAWNRLRDPAVGDDALDRRPDPARRSVLSSIVRRETADALAVAIDRLPVLLREAFVLRALEDLDYAAIAEITGARVNALQVRVHRARALLAAQLGSRLEDLGIRPRGRSS